jgi:hypothetical protein
MNPSIHRQPYWISNNAVDAPAVDHDLALASSMRSMRASVVA